MSAHRTPPSPALAPGTRVVRRGRDVWQVGINPGRRVLVTADPAAGEELAALHRGAAATGEPTGLSQALGRTGLLARPAVPLRQVAVIGDLGLDVVPFLSALQISAVRDKQVSTPGLFLSLGEPPREDLDRWLRQGRTHIVVRVVDGRVVIGPLVVPGRTACLRCVDCHRIDSEPEHFAVLHRYAHASRADGQPDTLSPTTTLLAIAWALHDLQSHLTGIEPVTSSSTLTIDESGIECVTWLRHPECACSWPVP